MIDSDVVIDSLFDQNDALTLPARLRPAGLSISVISSMEVAEGLAGSRSPARAGHGLRAFLRGTRLLVVGRSVADRAATIRLQLRQRSRPVNHRALDLMVAATAIEHNLTLVTRNVCDYQDIDHLQLLR
ncbi:MAG: type II toxin-antitoxin system VapC family toxin [Chloroflexota bacterium]|nr:type II toxin-antitoxin system VapC family toxin [Chloroflexota bacterium]